MKPKNFFKILIVPISLFFGSASGQIGFKTSLVSPDGDIGQYYNKGVSADLFVVLKDDDGPWRERAGIFYTSLKSRLDTVPVYAVQRTGNSTLILPGYLVDQYFSMYYLYIDIGYRIVRYKKFSLYVGAGLDAGQSHVIYAQGYETANQNQTNADLSIGGYRLTTDLEYKVSKHFEVFFEAVANRITTTNWSTKYEHNTFGLGANYYIKERKPHHKKRHSL